MALKSGNTADEEIVLVDTSRIRFGNNAGSPLQQRPCWSLVHVDSQPRIQANASDVLVSPDVVVLSMEDRHESGNVLYHHQRNLSDNQIAWILRPEEGLLVSPRQVRQIRCRCRWMRRHDAEVDALAQAQETQDLIQKLLAEGTIRQYVMRLLTTHLAVKYGHRARSDHVRAAIHILDQNGLASRGRVGQRKPRKNYVVPGPDWLWCLDGHDKLSRYGIAIYGCVDAYSRNIIWFYVGSSNRTAVSVVCQYLEAVGLRDKCPNYLRTDDGTEISMMADAQYFLYWADQVKEYEAGRRTAEDLAGVTVRDYFITGKSTANIRIEGLWGQLIRGQTESWMEYFALLSRNLFFRDDCATDKVVLTFIFMPIISREITDWVRVHPRPGTWIMHMYHGKGRKGLKPLPFQPWLGSMMLLDAMTALGWLTGKNNSDSLTADAFGVTFRWQPRSVGLFDFPGDDYTPSPPPSSPVHPPTLPRRTPTPSPERSPSYSAASERYPEYFAA